MASTNLFPKFHMICVWDVIATSPSIFKIYQFSRDSIENVIDISNELELKLKRVCKVEDVASPFLCESMIVSNGVLTIGASLKSFKIEAHDSPCTTISCSERV